jgi:Carbohydrate esterase, sialic acid-specific acetylesterase
MKPIKFLLGLLAIVFFVGNSYSQTLPELQITWPVNKSVFQRPLTGNAIISITAQTTNKPDNKIQFRIRKLDPITEAKLGYEYGNGLNWLDYEAGGEKTSNIPSKYQAVKRDVSLPTGWYLLETRTRKNSLGGSVDKVSIIFGVGDVYMIAGQSNASGFIPEDGDPNLINTFQALGTMPKAVSVINGNSSDSKPKLIPYVNGFSQLQKDSQIYPNGVSSWLWAPLAHKMFNGSTVSPAIPAPNIPVMFLNVAQSGSSIEQWKTTGTTFLKLQHFAQTFGSIFGTKSILWMQGEQDVNEHYEVTNNTWQNTKSTNPLSSTDPLIPDYSSKLGATISDYKTNIGSTNFAQWSIAPLTPVCNW